MYVLVGIEMTGTMAHKAMEYIQLAAYFIAEDCCVLQGNHGIEGHPFSRAKGLFAQIDM
jgi:hypothetical protein